MKWQYTGERKRLFGKWIYPGDIIDNPTKPPGEWVQVGKKESKTIEKEIGQIKDSNVIKELRKTLMKMKMAEIRKIGKEYNAYDTKKSELVDEIIQAKLEKGEL